MRNTPFLFSLILLVTLSGCLPHGCRRGSPSAVSPADSLSRKIARQTPTDTLQLVWTSGVDTLQPLEYPNSVARGPDGRYYVTDVKQSALHVFSAQGQPLHVLAPQSFAYPMIAGFRGDTAVVLNRGNHMLSYVLNRDLVRTVRVPKGVGTTATIGDDGIFLKMTGEDPWLGSASGGRFIQLDHQGHPQSLDFGLAGPPWEHRGFLRMWGDSLISLSGYRPRVYLLTLQNRFDTLRLSGFDSPMLSRTRAFLDEDVDVPPLLTASADPYGDHLFVLNMRPNRIRIDVYDRNGHLRYILRGETGPTSPGTKGNLFPRDLVVSQQNARDSSLQFGVLLAEPKAELRLYRWDSYGAFATRSRR